MKKVMITGQRYLRYPEQVRGHLTKLLSALVGEYEMQALVGMAVGTDLLAADVCRELHIPYVAYIPFVGQEKRWGVHDRRDYQRLIDWSDRVITFGDKYDPKLYHVRNDAMIRDSDMAIAVLGSDPDRPSKGTASVVRKLRAKSKPTFVIDPDTLRISSENVS